MSVGAHLDCDGGCGRFVFRRIDDDSDSLRRRAVRCRGWLVFEHKDLCNICRRRADEVAS